MALHADRPRMTRRTKTMAFLSGGLVLGLGITATLAAWTDSEWVFGGNADGTGPGLGTSTFEVEQNVSSPYLPAEFAQDETNPGQDLTFTAGALALTPGTSVYAPVALRTVAGSVAGTVVLQDSEPAVGVGLEADDADDALLGALTLRVAVSATATTCDAAAFATGALVTSGPLATAAGTGSQTLDASGGNTQFYCFEITLPAAPTLPTGVTLDDLQGRTVTPAWEFLSTSV
ncbi:acyl-CoA dehydrogenase [Clavibacter michiganensis]|uniref:SipW-dependent-type signal peptide-containing protein n=1 Tax=Clavibacter michiganensis TaxID=28447 RepID=UPI000CE741D1|nr:SipW-dependent-type signal peptide-containing protein [Clavibacter michiganensis]PPF53406.1 acyl-CoA dehydrogenase [Clavibacter michiganensis]